MIENIIKVDTHLQPCLLRKGKVFTQAQVDTPRAWTNESVSFGNGGVIKDVGACWWRRESGRVEVLISRQSAVGISNYARPERWTAKISHCIYKTTSDISGKNWTAVIATPEWGKACAALGEHVPGYLEPTADSIRPLGY